MRESKREGEGESVCVRATVGVAFKIFVGLTKSKKSCLIWQILVAGASKTVDRQSNEE